MAAWDKVRGVLSVIAPTIATALGGPAAGMAVAKVTAALGMPADSKPEDIEKQILAISNPDQYVAIKKADNEFMLELKQKDIDLEKINAADRDSARQREAVVKDKTPRNLAYMAVLSFWGFATAGVLIYFKENLAPDKVALLSGFIGTVSGYAISEVKQVFTYYFGSSSGSAEKTEVIAGIAKGGS